MKLVTSFVSAVLLASPALAAEPASAPLRETASGVVSQAPAARDDCLSRNLRVPPDVAEHLPARADLWFHVDASGHVRAVHANGVAMEELTPYLRDALRKCSWAPESGEAVHLRVPFVE